MFAGLGTAANSEQMSRLSVATPTRLLHLYRHCVTMQQGSVVLHLKSHKDGGTHSVTRRDFQKAASFCFAFPLPSPALSHTFQPAVNHMITLGRISRCCVNVWGVGQLGASPGSSGGHRSPLVFRDWSSTPQDGSAVARTSVLGPQPPFSAAPAGALMAWHWAWSSIPGSLSSLVVYLPTKPLQSTSTAILWPLQNKKL